MIFILNPASSNARQGTNPRLSCSSKATKTTGLSGVKGRPRLRPFARPFPPSSIPPRSDLWLFPNPGTNAGLPGCLVYSLRGFSRRFVGNMGSRPSSFSAAEGSFSRIQILSLSSWRGKVATGQPWQVPLRSLPGVGFELFHLGFQSCHLGAVINIDSGDIDHVWSFNRLKSPDRRPEDLVDLSRAGFRTKASALRSGNLKSFAGILYSNGSMGLPPGNSQIFIFLFLEFKTPLFILSDMANTVNTIKFIFRIDAIIGQIIHLIINRSKESFWP